MRLITTIGFVLYLSNVFAQTNDQKLIINKLTDSFYIYTTYNTYQGSQVPANGMYLVTDRGVALFDCPWDSTQFQPLLDSIKAKHNKNVVLCIATHSHEDRTAGLEYFKQKRIKTYTTIRTDNISKKAGKKRAQFLIDRDTVFKLGGYSFKTYYPGHGHAPDNIVIWFGKEKILYGGCFIKSTEATDLGNLGDADVRKWFAAIRKVKLKFNMPNYIIPGHGSWSSNQSIQHTGYLLFEHMGR